MRRVAVLCTILGAIASGAGCKVITGQHDCLYDPAAYALPPTDAKLPYATVGSPVSGVGVPAAPAPADLPTPKKEQ